MPTVFTDTHLIVGPSSAEEVKVRPVGHGVLVKLHTGLANVVISGSPEDVLSVLMAATAGILAHAEEVTP